MTEVKSSSNPLVIVDHVSKHYPVRQGLLGRRQLKAVDDVSLDIRPGETLGLVGESGSGKSTLGHMVVNLLSLTSGRISIRKPDGQMLPAGREMWRHVQMVFQNPYSSLNPKMTIRDTLAEPLRNFGISKGADADALIRKVLEECGLSHRAMDLYPREFSGGQRQRIGIARALILQPTFVVADEPVSALDVSIQAQIINLFRDLQRSYGLTYLFIAHDLALVRHVADRVAVMYLGRIIEIAASEHLYTQPSHPYTQLLLRSVPIPDPKAEAARLKDFKAGGDPSLSRASTGCAFSPRCPRARFPICGEVVPPLSSHAPNRQVACHFPDGAEAAPSATSH